MKLPILKWTTPVYVAQVLTATAGIGVVLVDENIPTKWKVLISVLMAAALMLSIAVTARTEADSERNRNHLETLVLSMNLPYFVIDDVTKVIHATARRQGWETVRQENFQHGTVYELKSNTGLKGRLVIEDQEFKKLWLLENAARALAIEARMFGTYSSTRDPDSDLIGSAIRMSYSEHVRGPHWVTLRREPDGTQVWEVKRNQHGPAVAFLALTPNAQKELLAMTPLLRYSEIAGRVKESMAA